ncbi:KICSTOR complex protein kaptin-like [Dendronephthya gigantea]|uniref:KICSTOR complex protein kaptin-like n=1 Tax=Dendronephthya gigantea TaxID=151771 RepID=UPI00106ADEE5|nr:KICSTOR complex protein kaptin-like [Dendronephthya gigantea]
MADEEDENKICFQEIQFFPIVSQTNVYGLSTYYESKNKCSKVLLACLKGNILCISSPQSGGPSSITSANVPLKNLQGADIVSIDAFNSSNGLHFGITFLKDSHSNFQRQYFNIYYGKGSELDTCKLESIADSCQTIELDFVPFQLIHARQSDDNEKDENVFLLSGSDGKIHLYEKASINQEFREQKVEDYFPEFQNLPNNVIWMDVYYDGDRRRLSCFACQNGFLKMVVVKKNVVIKEWSSMHDGPVSSVKIFTFEAQQCKISNELREVLELPEENEVAETANSEIHVLVTCVIEPSVIYEDVLNNGLSKLSILPDSDKYDCVVCSHISDVDWDGNNEILLGTFGQELMVYKLTKEYNENRKRRLQATLCWKKSFAQPLYAIDYVDLTNDGVRELIVASSKGLHVLQHMFTDIRKRFQNEFRLRDKEAEADDSSEN